LILPLRADLRQLDGTLERRIPEWDYSISGGQLTLSQLTLSHQQTLSHYVLSKISVHISSQSILDLMADLHVHSSS
jgi:hypothetical protein